MKLRSIDAVDALVACSVLSPPLHGTIHATGQSYKSHANFSCETGYKLSGAASVVCLANGSWSGDIPKCTGKPFEFALYQMHRKRSGRRPLNFAGSSGYKVVTASVPGRFQARPDFLPTKLYENCKIEASLGLHYVDL